MFSEPFHNVFREVRSLKWLQSRISLPAYSRGFYFFFQQHQSVGRSLTFRVSAYSRDRLIGEEIRYNLSAIDPHQA